MLRSSLQSFIQTTQYPAGFKAILISNFMKNEYHKRLRREIVMMPIPKPSLMNHKIIENQNSEHFIDQIFQKQLHNLQLALCRVSYCENKEC